MGYPPRFKLLQIPVGIQIPSYSSIYHKQTSLEGVLYSRHCIQHQRHKNKHMQSLFLSSSQPLQGKQTHKQEILREQTRNESMKGNTKLIVRMMPRRIKLMALAISLEPRDTCQSHRPSSRSDWGEEGGESLCGC